MGAFIGGDGTPVINGKLAMPCDCGHEPGNFHSAMGDLYLRYRCPECNAHLSGSGICLNACHLTAASLRRFEAGLKAAQAKVNE